MALLPAETRLFKRVLAQSCKIMIAAQRAYSSNVSHSCASRGSFNGHDNYMESEPSLISLIQLIGLREKLQEHPIFYQKIYGFL